MRSILRTLLLLLLLLPPSMVAMAFVSPSPMIAMQRQNNHRGQMISSQLPAKNFIDEILDGLDTMSGVSPLSESDLKGDNVDLVKRAEERDEVAPPSDALKKPSVSIFFFLLGFVPVVLSALAINAGFRPLGL